MREFLCVICRLRIFAILRPIDIIHRIGLYSGISSIWRGTKAVNGDVM